jgi:hypothetical protein
MAQTATTDNQPTPARLDYPQLHQLEFYECHSLSGTKAVIGSMADEVSKSEATPEVSHASPTVDKPSSGDPTTGQAPPAIDTPQKDVVMSDAPIEQAAVSYSVPKQLKGHIAQLRHRFANTWPKSHQLRPTLLQAQLLPQEQARQLRVLEHHLCIQTPVSICPQRHLHTAILRGDI